MSKIKIINNHSKKFFVFTVFSFTLVASFLFFDVFKKENRAKAEVCSSPVDVMMVIDRSGSMSEVVDGEQKIETAKTAALSFVGNLDSDNDRIGLEIFANSASIFDPGLTDNFGFINGKINSISFEEGGQTNTEAAIVLARGELINDGRGSAIKVMIILSDGVPNKQISTGDPVEKAIIAADVAKANGIRIIAVGFDIPVGDPAEIFMQEIASAPGDYYSSNNPPSCGEENYLVCIYNQISASICDNIYPTITNVSKDRIGTLYAQDDLTIVSQISDDFGFKEHKIKWSTDNWLNENIELCTVFAGTTNTCDQNIGTFGAGTNIRYKTYVSDTNNNETEGIEGVEDGSKSVGVASTTLEINGDINGKLQRNQNNTIKINITDPQGMANSDEFYVSVDSIASVDGVEFNKQLMSNCTGDGSNYSCSNTLFNPVCDTKNDTNADVFVYPKSSDIGYHNYATTKSVEMESIEESLGDGTCSDSIDNDCDGFTDLEESVCDNVAPVVNIKRKVSGVEVVNVYNNDSVTLLSTAVDYPIGLNGLISHTIYWYKNGVLQPAQSCGSVANCEIAIGAFPVGTEIKYYVKATDSSVSENSACGPAGCSTYYSFVVKDFECDGQANLVVCSATGACCNSVCDLIQSSNLFDDECSIAGCNGSDWGWVEDNETGNCSDGANSDGCYAVGNGCEERNYSCSSGLCSPVVFDPFSDTCVGLTLNDYGCNVGQCEIISSGIDASCDSQLESIGIVTTDSDGSAISDGGQVLDSKTSFITFISSASDTYGIAQHKIFWTSDNWTSTNEIDCGGVDECSGQIGPLNIGVAIKYYSRAVDGNGEVGVTSQYSFTVADSSCFSASDMTSCTVASGSGKCCNSLCDTSFDSTTLYDTECMVEGCNVESWEYVPIANGASCNAAGENACFDYFSGCEKRDYSCATGICTYSSVTTDTDVCSGDTFIDFGCSGADCSSLNDDCSDCTCGCGSYNLDEKIYSSLSFDGVNDYVNLGNSALKITGDQTIEMWINPSDFNARKNPYAKAYGGEGTITIETNGIVNYFYGTCGGNCSPYQGFHNNSAIQANEWTHLMLVRDLTKMKLRWYKNGILTNSTNATYSLATVSSLTAYIGQGYVSNFKGLIDEVRIYNRALADDEAFQHYQSVYQDESGLVGHWKFDDVGTVALDSSGNGNNGTLYGPTWVTSFNNINNVPSYWRTCSDTKNNDCDLDIDEFDAGCDGELTSLSASAEYGASLENDIPDNGDIYRSDMGTFQLTSVAIDDIFGISEHLIYWKINGAGLTSKDCVSFGTPNTCSIDEINLGTLNAGDVVEYKSYAVDTNNNSKCYPADCNDYYSFTVRDLECYDIDAEANVSGSCESETGECCGGICDTSFDDSNSNGYDADCKIEGCNGESWEWIPETDSTSTPTPCNAAASDLCSVFSFSGCETTNYSCSSGFCDYNPTDQKTDYCYDDYKFTNFGCNGNNCESTSINCKTHCGCSCGSYDLDEKIYSSLSFDGVNDYVNIPGLTWTPTIFSIEWWNYPLTHVNWNQQVIATNGWGAFVFHTTSAGGVYVGTDVTNRLTPTQLPAGTVELNKWQHFVFEYNGTTGFFYKNGTLLDSKNMNTSTAWGGFKIGTSSTNTVNGLIDEVRIYSRVLPEDEVLQHYQGVYQNVAGLVGHWKFDDTLTTGTAIDSSGNSNTGVLNGPTWAKSFKDTNKNNVPSYWQVCTDNKNNDCIGQKDSQELACDGELDSLSIKAENRYGIVIGDGDEVKDIDTEMISLIASPFDFDSGIKEVTIYWTDDNYVTTHHKTCGDGEDDFESDETCLAEIGPFDADVTVEYHTQGFDNNNNSKCYPSDCASSRSFDVILSNIAPIISELKKQQNESYCHGLDSVSFLWTYYDEDAATSTNTQASYEIQIKKGSVSDDPTVSGFFDDGLLLDIDKPLSTHSYLYNDNDTENNQDFEYNSTYYWRVRVKDVKGAFSDWVIYNDSGADDGDEYAESFSTPLHRYPNPDFDFSPNSPDFGEEITITDNSTAYDSGGNSNADLIKKWEWDFDSDGTIDRTIDRTVEIVNGDTTYAYLNPSINQYSIKLIVTDDDNFVCYAIKQINIATGEEYPRWNEISPSN